MLYGSGVQNRQRTAARMEMTQNAGRDTIRTNSHIRERQQEENGQKTKTAGSHRHANLLFFIVERCDPVGIRTRDPQLRRLLLYPAELPDQYPFT